jgi:hypothetical protein
LTVREAEILRAYAKQVGVSVSEVVRDFVKSLEGKKVKK